MLMKIKEISNDSNGLILKGNEIKNNEISNEISIELKIGIADLENLQTKFVNMDIEYFNNKISKEFYKKFDKNYYLNDKINKYNEKIWEKIDSIEQKIDFYENLESSKKIGIEELKELEKLEKEVLDIRKNRKTNIENYQNEIINSIKNKEKDFVNNFYKNNIVEFNEKLFSKNNNEFVLLYESNKIPLFKIIENDIEIISNELEEIGIDK